MEIIRLTHENAERQGYGCMLKGNFFIRNPKPYRDALLPELKTHLQDDLNGFTAVEGDETVGHILMGSSRTLGLPIIIRPEVPVILCTYIKKGYEKRGIGRALIDAARDAFSDQPGILVMSTNSKMYMHFKKFEKYGFRLMHAYDSWRPGYLAINEKTIQLDFYEPVLEWDYVKPFTLIHGCICPFVSFMCGKQKKAAESFKNYAPVEELTLAEALARDPKAIPGFYIFGKMVPAKPQLDWMFKRMIRKAIHAEEKKTFGTASPTGYKKRKS